MKVTEQHLSNGAFTTIDSDGVNLTVRTDHGHLTELRLLAVENEQKAARLIRDANMIREACRHSVPTS